jgi:hypothetical protein
MWINTWRRQEINTTCLLLSKEYKVLPYYSV